MLEMVIFVIPSCLIYLLPLNALVVAVNAPPPMVNTTYGPVSGVVTVLATNRTVKRFLGIPFAQAERLENPVPPDIWTSTLHANVTDKVCPQPVLKPALINEDCLQLNVFVPLNVSSSGLLPVMLWIHGGGYAIGDTTFYDGSVLATEGEVIVVAAAYRLGVLGFLSSPSDNLRGNYGMMDQVEAMKWVNKNIERFGGDPNKVTLVGESAGGMSVALLMLSPLTSGLYRNVIMQSGTAVALFSVLERSEADERARSFAKAIGCDDNNQLKACVKTKTVQEILNAQLQVFMQPILAPFAPVVDGYFLPGTIDRFTVKAHSPVKLLQDGSFNKTNVIVGVTKDDGSISVQKVPGIWPYVDASQGMTHAAFRDAINQRLWIRGQTAQIQELLTYEYTDWSNVDNVDVTRQRFIDINTDATFKAPAVLSAKAFAKKQLPTYFYQVEKAPESFAGFKIPSWLGVLHGSDLVYIFGYPLVTPSNLTSAVDIQLSKDMMTFWTNFAKSGNPNKPSYATTNWPQYTADREEYMGLGPNLTVRSKMLPDKIVLWNEFLPEFQQALKANKTGEKPTGRANGDEDKNKDKLVLALAVLTGVFGALAVILLVWLIAICCKRNRQGY